MARRAHFFSRILDSIRNLFSIKPCNKLDLKKKKKKIDSLPVASTFGLWELQSACRQTSSSKKRLNLSDKLFIAN